MPIDTRPVSITNKCWSRAWTAHLNDADTGVELACFRSIGSRGNRFTAGDIDYSSQLEKQFATRRRKVNDNPVGSLVLNVGVEQKKCRQCNAGPANDMANPMRTVQKTHANSICADTR